MTHNLSWQQRIGNQRDWVWRGWQTRYTYIRNRTARRQTPPLIFIHGFGASIEHWRNNLSFFSKHHTVYAIDLLGFGASRKASVDYTADLWREQIKDFWQTFIGQQAILIGNSIGSLVCLSVADKYPDLVAGLVMLSLPDVSVRQEMLPRLIRPLVTQLENLVASPLLIQNLLKLLRKRTIIRRWAGIAYYDKTAITEELVEILANPAYDRGSEKTLYALSQSIRKVGFAAPVKETISRLKIPMLLIWGLQDRMVPPHQARAIAALNPQIDLVELENVGHCPHDECPDRFNSLLLNWLEKL
ncbi:alpha/beta fold hydrolase [Myxosarcina sp. GI1(2024)]